MRRQASALFAGAAFREEGGRYDAGASAAIVSWLRERAGAKRTP